MTESRHRAVCLVTSAHVSANPRIVKEADALFSAGYCVTVIAADVQLRQREADRGILDSRSWEFIGVRRGSAPSYALRTLLQRISRFNLDCFSIEVMWLAQVAHHRLTRRLASTASKIKAELYIAHNLAALPAAVIAAQRNKAEAGFDAEDFHTEELTEQQRNRGDQIARGIIERRLLPLCAHRTTASPLIASAYNEKYGIKMLPILNVFPLSEAPERPIEVAEVVPRSLYWFSQTIGEGRGLEEIIAAMAEMVNAPNLYLRGNPAPGYAKFLRGLAEAKALGSHLHILPPAPPDEMVRLATPYSMGLSLELNQPLNRAICLTNKLFVYLLAGLPALLSRTAAHTQIATELGNAVILVDMTDAQRTAKTLEGFLNDEAEQDRARAKAWELGRSQFNWERESNKLLKEINRCFAQRRPEQI